LKSFLLGDGSNDSASNTVYQATVDMAATQEFQVQEAFSNMRNIFPKG